MSRVFWTGCAVVACGLLAVPAARADVSPDQAQAQAQALQVQLHDWLAAVLGPTVDLSASPVRITADGDHYRIEIPLPGSFADGHATVEGTEPITATAHLLDGGRWAIDDAHIPSPLKLGMTVALPKPSQTDITLTIAEQQIHGVVDPSLATASSLDGAMRGFSQAMDSSIGETPSKQLTSVERMSWHESWAPQAGGQMALQAEATMEGYADSRTSPGHPDITIAIDKIHAVGHVDQADFAAAGKLLRGALALAASVHPQEGKVDAEMTPERRAALHALLDIAGGLYGGMEGNETFDGVHVQAAGQNVGIATMAMSGGFGAPAGKADIRLRVALDGVTAPDLPPGPFRDYLPKHIELAPHISGVAKAELMKVLQAAIDGQDQDAMEVAGEVLAAGPVRLGLDTLALDLGPAKLTGTGQVQVNGPMAVTGDAELRMVGLDALMQLATKTPELKQALPVLVFLKGLGKPDGKATLWKITYHGNKLAVNGTDMSGMMPHGK